MHHFQSLDHTGNDWLDDVNSELSCGSRGTEGVHIRTQGAGEDAVVHPMRTALSKMITNNGQQRLRSPCRPLRNGLEKIRLVDETGLQGIGGVHGQDLGRQIFERPKRSSVIASSPYSLTAEKIPRLEILDKKCIRAASSPQLADDFIASGLEDSTGGSDEEAITLRDGREQVLLWEPHCGGYRRR
jgi:hypothetical protein